MRLIRLNVDIEGTEEEVKELLNDIKFELKKKRLMKAAEEKMNDVLGDSHLPKDKRKYPHPSKVWAELQLEMIAARMGMSVDEYKDRLFGKYVSGKGRVKS